MPAIVPPATILVTGVSGFVASHVARAYLEDGFTVRGTVRSPAKGEHILSLFGKEFPGKFDYVIADIENPSDLDAAAQGVDGIAHVASPVTSLPPGSSPQILIRPAVEGTLNVLRSAAKAGTVKRVVITGSIAAIIEPHEPPYTYSRKDWNDNAVNQVTELGGEAPHWFKYLASKVLAERAAYEWAVNNRPGFDLSHILPSWVSSLDDAPDTPKLLVNIFAAHEEASAYLGGIPTPYIHVRDVARAHVTAHIREELGHNSRLILSSQSVATFQQFYDAYWSLPAAERPQLPFDVPKRLLGQSADAGIGDYNSFENAEEALGWKFASLAETATNHNYPDMPIVAPPALILVTGVSGFVASHVAQAYLKDGFAVRGTVRSQAKGEHLRSVFAREFPGKFNYVIADIENPADLDAAAQGVEGIAHVASPVTSLPPGGDPQLLIRPAVEGTLNVLRSAAKAGTVKRVVVTGSIAAVVKPHHPPYSYSAKDWNDHAVKLVEELGGQAPSWNKYAASKVLAERAAYKWAEENKPTFDISHILPSWVFGPVSSVDDLPATPNLLINIFAAPEEASRYVGGDLISYIHVADVARAHVAAHVREDLGQYSRLILSSRYKSNFQQFYAAYWSLPDAERPQIPFAVPKGTRGLPGAAEIGESNTYENAEEVLGWKFASLAETIRDTLADITPRIYHV
ncbi:NAD(P)-binding protein [Auricularia subglabra TFB-10046 SS5]|nr:NAD(P)-binding protein [Auricularia subglabra TFB-10046 SS5]